MARRYKTNSIPMSGGVVAYNKYTHPDYREPVRPMSVTVQSPPIRRGETFKFSPDEMIRLGPMCPTHFIYTGSKDLWLLSAGSHSRGCELFPTDIHLESFRPGAPCEIAWGAMVWLRDLTFVVEHRTKIKNAQPAQFIARIYGYPAES